MKYLVALSLIDLPLHIKSKLFLIFNNNFDVLFNNKLNLDYIKSKNIEHLNFNISKINSFDNWTRVDHILNYSIKNKFKIISPNDNEYPNLLLEMPDFPVLLYTRGFLNLLNYSCISVVGSRKASFYSTQVLEKFIPLLIGAEYCVVSGMAIGVDSIAHKIALKNKGKTIAVLGTGVDVIYPATNKNLYDNILSSDSLIISEYCFNTPAYPKNFPTRNRIIAGLSKNIIIVEAKLRSGSLITARLAIEYNRNVFAVPGSIFSDNSDGTNELIKNGATLLSKFEDLNINFKLNKNEINLNEDEKFILNLIDSKGVDFNFLLNESSYSISILSCILDNLQKNKLVFKDDFDMIYKS